MRSIYFDTDFNEIHVLVDSQFRTNVHFEPIGGKLILNKSFKQKIFDKN